jgi:hypothetical protein
MDTQTTTKRRVRTTEERRQDLMRQLQLVDAREEARMRAMLESVIVKLETVKAKANASMKGKMHDACNQAIAALKPHVTFPGP